MHIAQVETAAFGCPAKAKPSGPGQGCRNSLPHLRLFDSLRTLAQCTFDCRVEPLPDCPKPLIPLGLPKTLEASMRLRVLLLFLCLFTVFAMTGCNKPASDSSSDTATNDTQTSGSDEKASSKEAPEHKEHKRKEAKRQPLVVPSGTAITISLGSSIGSKLSKPGDALTASAPTRLWV